MIIDCFTFFQELDVLEIRLNTLKDVVDKFVIVEANSTYSGKSKPYILEDHMDLLRSIGKPVEYAWVELVGSPWERERQQRDLLKEIIQPNPDDTVMVSDLDEIPYPEVVKRQETCRVISDLYYFHLNTSAQQKWTKGTYMIKGSEFNSTDSLTDLRLNGDFPQVDGGWHFSSLGGKEKILTKLRSFAHTELDNEEDSTRVLLHFDELRGIHGDNLTVVPVSCDFLPTYAVDNQVRFQHLIWQ